MKKLNLGCGLNKKPKEKDWINLDSSPEIKPDIVWDLEKTPLPFKDNNINEVLAEHVFEHIKNFIPLMHDLYRICKNHAKIKIRVPFYASAEQYTDPTHIRFFSPFTFNYFDAESNIKMFSHEVKTQGKMFKINKVKLNFGVGRMRKMNWLFNPIINLNHRFYCRFLVGFFPASEIYFELEVLK